MANDTSTYISNSIVGETVTAFNPTDAHATQKHALGKRVALEDGRVFRYAYFGTDTGQNLIAAPDISGGGLGVTDNSVVAPASAQTTSDGTIGSKFVEITVASIGVNDYAGGYLHTEDDTGEGYTYRIKSNTATDDPASGNLRLELYDPLKVALDATTDIAITPCLYNDLIGATAATDYIISGATCSNMDVSEAPYGWVQTWGVTTCQADGSVTAGDQLSLSDSETGTVQVLGGGGSTAADILAEQIVGYALYAGTDNAQVGVYLQITP